MSQTLPHLITSVLLALCLPLGAQAHSTGEHSPQAKPHQESARVSFADVQLIDQDSRSLSLERDLLADHIAVVGLIYTSCGTVCPVISSIMGRLQQQLGERAGREVQLVSISVDPLRDTPQVLREYAGRFQHGPGWSWLTGTPAAIDATLRGLGVPPSGLADHPPLILVGDTRSGRWTRFYGFTDPQRLLARIDALQAQAGQVALSEVQP